MNSAFNKRIQEHLAVIEALLKSPELSNNLESIVDAICTCFNANGKVFFAGNGGSAADAQHLAAELSGRFYFNRPPLFAEALHVNTSYLTAVANDFGYDHIYSRLVDAKLSPRDILIAFSTSGKSTNILLALEAAKNKGALVISFCGENQNEMKPLSNFVLSVPSSDTPRIQEAHILLGHLICEQVEMKLFGDEKA